MYPATLSIVGQLTTLQMSTSPNSKRPKRMATSKAAQKSKTGFNDLPPETQKEIFRNVGLGTSLTIMDSHGPARYISQTFSHFCVYPNTFFPWQLRRYTATWISTLPPPTVHLAVLQLHILPKLFNL